MPKAGGLPARTGMEVRIRVEGTPAGRGRARRGAGRRQAGRLSYPKQNA